MTADPLSVGSQADSSDVGARAGLDVCKQETDKFGALLGGTSTGMEVTGGASQQK